mmetsp:Transcript_59456/g.104042  ORF Transcript_59456/g.104042 Transcript_59456/m.104042 type:complete len:284 (-) Transcript_59456:51-902(-)
MQHTSHGLFLLSLCNKPFTKFTASSAPASPFDDPRQRLVVFMTSETNFCEDCNKRVFTFFGTLTPMHNWTSFKSNTCFIVVVAPEISQLTSGVFPRTFAMGASLVKVASFSTARTQSVKSFRTDSLVRLVDSAGLSFCVMPLGPSMALRARDDDTCEDSRLMSNFKPCSANCWTYPCIAAGTSCELMVSVSHWAISISNPLPGCSALGQAPDTAGISTMPMLFPDGSLSPTIKEFACWITFDRRHAYTSSIVASRAFSAASTLPSDVNAAEKCVAWTPSALAA